MTTRYLILTLLASMAFSAVVTAQETRLLRHPTVSRDSVAFEAVKEALKLLEQNPQPQAPRPAPIDRVSPINRVSK
jgi:hypothetical protein